MGEENPFRVEGRPIRPKKTVTNQLRENPWILSTVVLGIFVLVFVIGTFDGVGSITGNVVSSEEIGEDLLAFYQSQGGIEGLSLDSVEEVSGVYRVNFLFEGTIVPIYVTKDGKFAGQLNLIPDENTPPPQDPNTPPPESGREVVDVDADDDAVQGDVNAPVTIIEFSDYECPFCGMYFTDAYGQIKSEYVDTGKVKLVFRDFPLDFHENAQKAAEAAECAGKLGGDEKYWEMHDKLFSNQENLDVDSLKEYGQQLGLNSAEFNACLDSGEMEQEVKQDMLDGQGYGVTATPAFFINGKLFVGAQPFSVFRDIIEAELALVV